MKTHALAGTYKITLQGRVQGVGFRPFVYREALRHGIRGSVSNNEEGVIICASGPETNVQAFYRCLVEEPPAIARVMSHSLSPLPFENPPDFRIVPSETNSRLNLQLTPDFALCERCASEISDPKNRRHGYPFTSCVNCGPRWSITDTFPFEREHTRMDTFPMCPKCVQEYTAPTDRRFHSQTNSCSACGIRYWLSDTRGKPLGLTGEAIFEKLALALEQGQILALKNSTGYLLCCDARQGSAVQELRRRKKRPGKPFAVLYPSLEVLHADLEVSPEAAQALRSPERPIVLLPSGRYRGEACLEDIAPNLDQLGVMLPYTGVLALLARAFPHPVIATSGNLHGSPICYAEADALEKLGMVADLFFHHNLEISQSQDDSVVRFTEPDGVRIVLRRSRGMAPNFGQPAARGAGSRLLALGAHLKSSVAFVPNDFLYLSQYLGNLDHFEVYERFTQMASGVTRLFDTPAAAVLVDAHPGYQSTLYGKALAKEGGIPCHSIQHHKAHFAAVLGENGLLESTAPVLGVIWDGTGYGDDGQVWGGEFFGFERGRITREGHLDNYDWLAGDKMAREPRLSLLALAQPHWEEVQSKFSGQEWQVYAQLKSAGRLKTSSMGRLFDAVASLLGLCDLNTFEGEAAMRLEAQCLNDTTSAPTCYTCLDKAGNIPARALLARIRAEANAGVAIPHIIRNFMYTLARLVIEKAETGGYRKIAFSGGVFQNARLVEMLRETGGVSYDLYFHRELSPNDENIAYGQLMYHLHCQKP